MEVETIAAIGPRAFTPDVATSEVRQEIAHSQSLQWYREICATWARWRVGLLHKQHAAIWRDNQAIELKACDGLGVPYLRNIPQEEYLLMRAQYGDDCWQDPKFEEAYWLANPWARANVTRGTRGQSYAGTRFVRRKVNLRSANFGGMAPAT